MKTPDEKIRYSVNFNMGLFSIVFLVLFVLKLCGVIAWPWWVVFSPLYMPFIASVLFLITFWAVMCFIEYYEKKRRGF